MAPTVGTTQIRKKNQKINISPLRYWVMPVAALTDDQGRHYPAPQLQV